MTNQEFSKLEDLKVKNLRFQEKVVKVQSELKAPKGQYNSFGKYKYRSCEDIVESVKPILAKYGLTIKLSDELLLVGERYYIKATATITDGTDKIETTAYAREPQEKKGMDESQITGTASSYARKYALNGLLAIDDTDADADEYTNQTKKELDSDLVRKCQELNINLNSVAVYFKKSVELLTNEDLKMCIAMKQKANTGEIKG